MKNKKLWRFLPIGLLIGLLTPVARAFAIISLITKPVEIIVTIAFGLILALGISFAVLSTSNAIFSWVASPNFVRVPYTHFPNVVVDAGWTVVRDFTNLLFILVIVAIGIATALRIREYEVRKTLPRLILIAILINFTPTICGVIIDASNILMNFFFTAGTAGYSSMLNFVQAAGNILANAGRNVLHNWTNFFNGVFFFQVLFVIAFNLIASFVLLFFAVLLILRHVALWILVILAPLAFFAYILPATRRIWHTWWHQFIQWCFVGVGGAFFIYLTQLLMQEASDNYLGGDPGTVFSGGQVTLSNQITTLLTFSVPLILLLAGAFVTMSTSAAGASAIVKLARTQGRRVASAGWKAISKTAKETGKGVGRKVGGVVSPKVREKIERLETATIIKPKWGEGRRGLRGMMARGAAGIVRAVPTGITRGVGKALKIATAGRLGLSYQQRLADEAQKKAEGKTAIENAVALEKAATAAEKAGFLQKMAEKGQLKENIEKGRLSKKSILEGYKAAKTLGLKKAAEAIEKSFSHNKEMVDRFAQITHELTPKKKRGSIVGLTKEDEAKGIISFLEKIWRSLKKKEDFEQINFDEIQKDEELLDKFTKTMLLNPQQLAEAGRTLGKSFVDAAQEKAEEVGASWFYELDEKTGKARAPGTLRYLTTTGALALGYAPIPGAATREEMRGFEVEARHWETALRRAKTENEIEALQEELEKAERESANEEIKRIITSVRRAAEAKLQRLRESTEEETSEEEEEETEAGE